MYAKIKNTKLSRGKVHALITEWCYMTPSSVCAKKLHLTRRTTDLWYRRIQEHILHLPPPPQFTGTVEVDETYFGKKPKGMKGTGMVGKTPILGIRSRETGHVWAQVMNQHMCQDTIIPVLLERIEKGTTVYTDGFGAYAPLNSLGYIHHRVYHAHTFVTSFDVHTNGIESFWRYLRYFFRTKRTIHKKLYHPYLQEAVFRFNTPNHKKLRSVVKYFLNL